MRFKVRNYWIALAIAILAALWFVPNLLNNEDDPIGQADSIAGLNTQEAAIASDAPPTRVRGRISVSSNKQRVVTLTGRTENKRTVIVRAEVGGMVEERPIELGDHVKEDQTLCKLEIEERQALVAEAQDQLRESLLEYDGQLALRKTGLQIERQIATAKARVTQAKTQLLRSELNLERSSIKAPFTGFVEEVHVEVGDFLQLGAPCATIVDLDPMKINVNVSENEVHHFEVGSVATARLPSGKEVSGEVTFVGQQSENATRTFLVEILIDNKDSSIRSGLTAELLIPLETYVAHQVPVALLGIDDAGTMGLRLVDNNNQVYFQPITIVAEDAGGVWVTGLPEITTLITVGQDFVVPGEVVDVEYQDEL